MSLEAKGNPWLFLMGDQETPSTSLSLLGREHYWRLHQDGERSGVKG